MRKEKPNELGDFTNLYQTLPCFFLLLSLIFLLYKDFAERFAINMPTSSSYFQKTGKSLNKHFQEVSNDESSNTRLSRVESESVAEMLNTVKNQVCK